ncbi:MAG: xanthine dehydrogenase [Pseudonocardiales bacterium]|nr:MAG: xanthine dehydrogenase [Pseudonocardiales bacterium]
MSAKDAWVGDRARYARGQGRYVADVRLPGQAALCIVRSYLAHGTIGGIDVSETLRAPGVLGAWTAADIIADLGELPVIRPRISDDPFLAPYLQGVLARDRVRYVGEPVAVVAAETRHLAEDAAERVVLDLEPLEAVTDLATAAQATELFDAGNLITTSCSEFGEVDAAFASAPVVVEHEVRTGRHSGMPMETRGVIVDPVSDGRITIWGAAKVPHANRRALSAMLGVSEARIRMLETDVGGGFGIRGEFYPEDFLTTWAAMQLRRPLGWIEDRWEHMVAANQSRGQLHRASVCATREGELLGLRSEFWLDAGAYVRTVGVRVADLTLGELPGPYRFPSYRGRAHCVVTNLTPTGTYRSPGRFESSFVRERLLDMLAERLGIGGRELRRRNLVRPADMPYRSGLVSAGKPVTLSAGDYPSLFDRVCGTATQLHAEIAESMASEPDRVVGMGIGAFIEKSGLGPFELALVQVAPDGSVVVRTGATFFGQGLHQALARIVGDQLHQDPGAIRVMKMDTDQVEEGIGTYASRGVIMAGSAALAACRDLLDRARHSAALLLEVAPAALDYQHGAFRCTSQQTGSVTLAEAAGHSPDGFLVGRGRHEAGHVTFGFGAHAAICSVDTSTGQVRVEAMVLGYDAGRVIDAAVVEGQLQGAAMQAVGGALLECFSHDEAGTPLATTFMDYLLPTAADAPRYTVILGDSVITDNPLGARGAGEAGIPGVAAAIARAIESACGKPAGLFATPIRADAVWDMCSDLSRGTMTAGVTGQGSHEH